MKNFDISLAKRIEDTEGLLRILAANGASEKRLKALDKELEGFYSALRSAEA